MKFRSVAFACALAIACALICVGIADFSLGAAKIVGGLELAGLAWLVLSDDTSPGAKA